METKHTYRIHFGLGRAQEVELPGPVPRKGETIVIPAHVLEKDAFGDDYARLVKEHLVVTDVRWVVDPERGPVARVAVGPAMPSGLPDGSAHKAIRVRFDLYGAAALVSRADMLTVPLPGELINLEGNPYVVKERSWAVDEEDFVYAYIKVIPSKADAGGR